jgi:hypothetical protein
MALPYPILRGLSRPPWAAPHAAALPGALARQAPRPLPAFLTQRFRIIAFIRRDDLEAFARATPFTGSGPYTNISVTSRKVAM